MDVRCAPVDMRAGCGQKEKQSLTALGKGGFQKACGAGTGGQFAEGSRKGCEGHVRASEESGTLGGRETGQAKPADWALREAARN